MGHRNQITWIYTQGSQKCLWDDVNNWNILTTKLQFVKLALGAALSVKGFSCAPAELLTLSLSLHF